MSAAFPRPHRRWVVPRSVFAPVNILLFLLPALTAFRFNAVGQLMVSDFLAAALFAALLARGRINLRQAYLRPVLIFYALWVAGMVLSDIVNQSPVANMAKGWALVGLFGIYLVVFFTLVDGRRDRLFYAMIGVGAAALLTSFTGNARGAFFGLQWKFGAGLSVTLLFLLALRVAGLGRRKTGFWLMAAAPLHLFLGARSLFLLTFLSGALSAFTLHFSRPRDRVFAISLVIMLLFGGMIAGEAVFGEIVKTGVLGQEMLNKYLAQTAGGRSIFFGGRPESIVSLRAISESPLLGHGSWAEKPQYRYLLYQLLQAQGAYVNWNAEYLTRVETIPSHSILLGTWVQHGVLAGLFWASVLVLGFRALLAGAVAARPGWSYEFLAIATLLWDTLFSPFGGERRCVTALFIVIAAALLADHLKSLKKGQGG